MKNQLIFNLVNAGVLNTTAYELPASQAYKALKFRSIISKAYEGIIERIKEINKTNGIEDEHSFIERHNELLKKTAPRTEEEQAELDKSTKTLETRNKMIEEMLNDDTSLEGVRIMPFEDFFALQKENKDVGHSPFRQFESALEGVLWETPKEDETTEK